ncbi:MAG: efflux RND transporter periplasmic adaptor subunit [Verrucomicrobia bacterium]|nr:efflux RND transporter periplasmic adaptor subunit [Verrucomicrobiota bacterium]
MKVLRILLPLFILAISGGGAYWIYITKPEPRQRNFNPGATEVEVFTLSPSSYQVELETQGTVQARTTSTLIPEVRGRILEISPKFREGAFFEEGDMLLRIDPRDYQTELIVAEANLSQAELSLFEEQARADQAYQDWKRLNLEEEPGDLVLRTPQLKRAKANVASTAARLETAHRNIEKTEITAPYAGRVLSQIVDIGQYVSPGTQLARIYAVDFAEVRLPLTETQLTFLDLPETYRGEQPNFREGPTVTLSSTVAGKTHEWRGRIVRAEGSFDIRTRQLFVIAQVRNPYGRTADDRPPLKMGSFVKAKISGSTLDNVFVVPRRLLRENTFLLTVDDENLLRRKIVHIVWQNDNSIIVDEGLAIGDRICLTDVPFALEALPVSATELEKLPFEVEKVDVQEIVARRAAAPPSGGGPAGFLAQMMTAIPDDKPIPGELKTKLDAAIASGDRNQIRPLMQEVRDWAETQGIELPAGRGGPRG